MIRYIDLFAGIGGIRLGTARALERAGLPSACVLSSEIDEKARETYQLNFQGTPQGDIRDIVEIPPFDLLLAGFPCQPFSYAGKKRGFGDTRGTLFFEIERILDAYRPPAFLLENVRGLKSHDGGRTFGTIMETLHGLGYGTAELILNSSDFGVAQNRVRLYLLGLYGGTPSMGLMTNLGAADSHKYKMRSAGGNACTVGQILEPRVPEKYYCSPEFTRQLRSVVGDDLSKLHGYRLIDYRGGQSIHSWELGRKGKCTPEEIRFMNLLIQNRRKHNFGTQQDGKMLTLEQIQTFYQSEDILQVMASLKAKGYLKEKNGRFNPVCGNMSFEVFKFLDPESISITLTSSDANRLGVVQNNQPRRITPRECARLQGFQESFLVHPTDGFAYKQLGNSVTVPVIEAVMYDFVSRNRAALGW